MQWHNCADSGLDLQPAATRIEAALNNEDRMTDLAFDYTLRISQRARFIRLYVSPHKGLEIVVPHGFNCKHLPAVLQRKSAWITRALERVRPQR